jgi:hypothetical protein
LERLIRGRVLDVVSGVVREDGRVAGGEVESAGGGLGFVRGMCGRRRWGWKTYVADEGGGAGGAGEEVEPFFGLDECSLARFEDMGRERDRCLVLTFGCQCSSLSAPGLSVTIEEAMVFATGKLRESTVLTEPPPPAAISGSSLLALKT